MDVRKFLEVVEWVGLYKREDVTFGEVNVHIMEEIVESLNIPQRSGVPMQTLERRTLFSERITVKLRMNSEGCCWRMRWDCGKGLGLVL